MEKIPIRKPKSVQKPGLSKDSTKSVRNVSKKSKAIKKPVKKLVKKVLKIGIDRVIIKQQAKGKAVSAKKKSQDEKMAAKMAKSKLLILNPNLNLPDIKANSLLEKSEV